MGAKRTSLIVTAILSAVVLGLGTAFAIDIPIANSGFESGNVGFTSGYEYFGQPATPATGYGPDYGTASYTKASLYDEGTYGVGTNPALYHGSWASFGAQEGTMMMIVNGATGGVAPVTVWEQTVTGLTLGETYFFSAYVTSVYPPPVGSPAQAPADLLFSADGAALVPTVVTADTGVWVLYYRSFVAGDDEVTLSLVNFTTAAGGNDFAVDNIRLSTSIPTPEPTTLLLLGLGLLGMAGVRRFRK